MSNANGIITAPVSIDDVKTVLGESSNDLATLCSSQKINMWARFKPVSYPSVAPIDDAIFSGIKNIPYWNSIPKMLDWINAPSSNNPPANLSYDAKMWVYDKPSGGASSPYRLSDFKNYWHGAGAPLGPCTVNSVQVDDDGDFWLYFAQGEWCEQHLEIRMSDLSDNNIIFSDCYFGLAFYSSAGHDYEITSDWKMTDDDGGMFRQIKNQDGTVVIHAKHAQLYIPDKDFVLPGSTWTVVPFASTVEISTLQASVLAAGMYIPIIPAVSALAVATMQVTVSQLLSAIESSGLDVSVSYIVQNKSQLSITISSIEVDIYSSNSNLIGKGDISAGDTISAGAGKTYTGNVSISGIPAHAIATVVISGKTFTCECAVKSMPIL